MRQLSAFVIFAFLLVLVVPPALSETKPLTNADVIKMVKAELPDETIAKAIKASDTAFDTSPDALLQLKSAGGVQDRARRNGRGARRNAFRTRSSVSS